MSALRTTSSRAPKHLYKAIEDTHDWASSFSGRGKDGILRCSSVPRSFTAAFCFYLQKTGAKLCYDTHALILSLRRMHDYGMGYGLFCIGLLWHCMGVHEEGTELGTGGWEVALISMGLAVCIFETTIIRARSRYLTY